jgi:hypothetical protein
MMTQTRSYLAAFAGTTEPDSCLGAVDHRLVRELTAAERAELARDLRTDDYGRVVAGELGEIHVARWGRCDDPGARGDVRVVEVRSASVSPDADLYQWEDIGSWASAAEATPRELLRLVRQHLAAL